MTEYTIRSMSRGEVDIVVDWAGAEGWNPGRHDADCFYAADSGGFLVGLLGGEPVAAISVVKYGKFFGFLGLYIVKPEYRGLGYGFRIWRAGLDALKGRTVGLDGVVAQQENYRKSGFSLAYRNIRYQGAGGGIMPVDPGIVGLESVPFDDIRAYDGRCFPAARGEFLECWIAQPESTALGILEQGRLAGYGLVRACRTGYKIGPLFADWPDLAERLFLALKARVPEGAQLFLDTPEANPDAVALAKAQGMSLVFETARMYLGSPPALPLNRIFGVTSFELG